MKLNVMAAVAALAFMTAACVDDPVTPVTPTPEPTPQPFSLVGTTWAHYYESNSETSIDTLRFFTDSTGVQYLYKTFNGQVIFDSYMDIMYHFDNATMNGAFYPIQWPNSVINFFYDSIDTTLMTLGNHAVFHLVK